jgi:uncharacterized protein (TIGR02271 family)
MKKDFGNEIEGNAASTSLVIPVIEEYVKVDKREVESGRIHVKKKIKEEEELISVPIFHDEYHIERVPVGKQVDVAPFPIVYEGDTIIIPVLQEEVTIVKRLVLVEEIRITKCKVESTYKQPITLRKEEVTIVRK